MRKTKQTKQFEITNETKLQIQVTVEKRDFHFRYSISFFFFHFQHSHALVHMSIAQLTQIISFDPDFEKTKTKKINFA